MIKNTNSSLDAAVLISMLTIKKHDKSTGSYFWDHIPLERKFSNIKSALEYLSPRYGCPSSISNYIKVGENKLKTSDYEIDYLNTTARCIGSRKVASTNLGGKYYDRIEYMFDDLSVEVVFIKRSISQFVNFQGVEKNELISKLKEMEKEDEKKENEAKKKLIEKWRLLRSTATMDYIEVVNSEGLKSEYPVPRFVTPHLEIFQGMTELDLLEEIDYCKKEFEK